MVTLRVRVGIEISPMLKLPFRSMITLRVRVGIEIKVIVIYPREKCVTLRVRVGIEINELIIAMVGLIGHPSRKGIKILSYRLEEYED